MPDGRGFGIPSAVRVASRFRCVARERGGFIPFPEEYEEALRLGDKSMTVRVDDEVGLYREGETYDAVSYDGRPWGVAVEVRRVVPMAAWDLGAWGVPAGDVSQVVSEARDPGRVELVQFGLV